MWMQMRNLYLTGTLTFCFSSFIQRFDAKDSWKPNPDGEDTELLRD